MSSEHPVAQLSAERMMSTIQDLVAMAPRASGTPGGLAAAEYVARRFREAGLVQVGFEEVSTYSWTATEAALRVGPHELPCGAIRHCCVLRPDSTGELGTGPDGLTASVVDIGTERVKDHDVRGKIVLFDLVFAHSLAAMGLLTEYFHDPVIPGRGRQLLRRDVLGSTNPYMTNLTATMEACVQGGAVGVIGVLRDYPESHAYHNEYWRRRLLTLPGVWITRDTGALLRGLLTRTPTATLRLGVRREEVTARSVVGQLPGRTSETIMVQSHHDSVGPGAVEDGTGVAEVVALAEHYASTYEQGMRDKTLMFVTFDTHFTGYQAHMEFMTKYVLEERTLLRLIANATIEHVGLRAVRGADGGFEVTGGTEPRGFFETLSPRLKWALVKAVRRHGMAATMLLNATPLEFASTGIPTDASFGVVAGVPTVSLVSGPLYLYDDADTIDKVDVDQLEPVARTFIDIIDAIERTPSGRVGMLPSWLRRRLPRGKW